MQIQNRLLLKKQPGQGVLCCNSDEYFVNSSPESQNFFKKKEKSVLKFITFPVPTFKTVALIQSFSQECVPKKYFSYFSTKTYIVGAQKNCLNETVLLSAQNTC